MKKMSMKKMVTINGGAPTHYHWVCTVNDFWSKKYESEVGARRGLNRHLENYPDHRSKVYVLPCTGDACK